MSYCTQQQTVHPIECGDRATFVAWTKNDPTSEEVEVSCTQHLAKAVAASYAAAGRVGYVRVAPIERSDTR